MWSTLPPNLAALAFEFVALDDIAAAKPVAKFVAAAARHALTQGRWRSHAVCARDGAAIVRRTSSASSASAAMSPPRQWTAALSAGRAA